MKITRELLERLDACPDQVAIFAAQWPNGAALTLVNGRTAEEKGLDIDWLALQILTAPAWTAYREATDAAEQAYLDATAPAWQDYLEATDADRKACLEPTDADRKDYLEATDADRKAYHKATAPAEKDYLDSRAAAFVRAARRSGIKEEYR